MASVSKELVGRFWSEDSAQGLVEYVLIIALVAIGLVAALTVFRNHVGQTLDQANTQLASAPSGQYQPGSAAGGSGGGTGSGGSSGGGTGGGSPWYCGIPFIGPFLPGC